MSREIIIAGAQMGPIARNESRASAVARMVALLDKAARLGAQMVVFPELALTTFFPRWFMADQQEIDIFFETAMPNEAVAPLFARARALGISFTFGFAEKRIEDGRIRRFNTSIMVDAAGEIVARYRKIHLPGHAEHEPWRAFQHLEKRYFEPGEAFFETVPLLGGRFSMAICNDRRWPETYREMALRGAEVATIGYNTPLHYAQMPDHDHLQSFHNHLCMQAGAYQNGMWVVGVGKTGVEEGCALLGQSCIVAPTGEIVAMAGTVGDEVIVAVCDLDRCAEIREHVFNFARNRRPAMYPLLSAT
ncbi:N-carbamoyl-D-amino-acid hydrolase [Gluconacetobacter tumulicola]|uniref:N-carbamoyl-D-amino-acid hydrolase n=1 Tax=Gluconacetobacter tumulicola TaxID=1017177 RepID=A0A7W4JCJ1_9PROT|nr:N-carbamoyl-D-amino-acid hydrolase [Gluconacetobacter tumulicola]MBB2178750.1 N-carbamoyl-D-amino-acid hydrolase [Gluconacetobacter tumulicola]